MTQIQFISTTPDELKNNLVNDLKNALLPELVKNFQPKEPTTYLTRQEVADLLKIDLSTVHNWSKKGKLQAYAIGGRVYYKRHEVEQALINL